MVLDKLEYLNYNVDSPKNSIKKTPQGGEQMTVRQILCLVLVVLSSVQAGMHLGRLLTLWQKEAKDRDHEREHRKDEITDIK